MRARPFAGIIYLMKPLYLIGKQISLGLVAAALLGVGTAFAAPAQVILIRHAEKPEAGPELNEQGVRRAQALVKFFKSEPAVRRYGAPAVIYAAAPKNEDSSLRSIQTVTPLARALGLRIDDSFTRGQTNKLVREIMENPAYDGRMVLVCWQHVKLVDAALALAEYNNSPKAVHAAIPQVWPDEAFDRVWILDFHKGKAVSFRNIPQRLLPGDSSR
jgi:hypothetical protein